MRIAGHDLRNPLCLILMSGELARRQPALAPGIAKFLNNIDEGAAQMRRIIDTFLDLRAPQPAGAASGRIDLGLLAAAVVRQHEHAAERRNITVETAFAENLPLARCDAAHGYQAFTNFISNALKFTRPAAPSRCAPRSRAPNPRRDPRRRPRHPGRRARATLPRTRPPQPAPDRGGEESNGLGLAIVKHLVESQGGTTGAEFPETGGSLFWFELPVAP